MKNYILYVAAMVALAACVPAPVQNRGDNSSVSSNFSIDPEGTWLPNCQDVSTATGVGGLMSYQLKIVFAEKEPTFSLVHDFLTQNCKAKDEERKVALSKYLKGKITLGQHTNLDDGRRARVVEVDVSTESYKPATDVGVKYLKQIVSTEMGAQVAIGKELVVPQEFMPYKKLHGMLVVKKNARNAMHVYLDPKQKNAKDIEPHLNDSNLYLRHITK